MTALEADYLVVGAGAMGMAFVDTVLAETDATIALVDEGHQPGGHWAASYPFVRLHQPSSYYGVNSRPLGREAVDEGGWNKGFFELATGNEVCAYYEQVMRQQHLPTGRLSYYPMAQHLSENVFRTLDGAKHTVKVRCRIVDATYLSPIVPSMRPPPYPVAGGVDVIAPNGLPRAAFGREHFTVVGAGKTGMDACLWLLRHGVPAARLRWVMPRDSWMMNRANIQPGPLFVGQLRASIAARMKAIASATDLQDLFTRLETDTSLLRLDAAVWPTMYHCAIVSLCELEQLRSILDVVRLGRVLAVETDRLVLEEGVVSARADSLYVDCTATGLPPRPAMPVFDGDRITLQSVRGCQQVFSAALIAHVEATYGDDDTRNNLCAPVPHPDTSLDWLRITLSDNAAQARWLQHPELTRWLESARLNVMRGLFPPLPDDPQIREQTVAAITASIQAANNKLALLMQAG